MGAQCRFVSNLEGTTMREIAAMSALLPVRLLLLVYWVVGSGSASDCEEERKDLVGDESRAYEWEENSRSGDQLCTTGCNFIF
jgi:hypothetical protein